MRTCLVQHIPNPIGTDPVPSGPISLTRCKGYSTAAIELMGFKKGIKREIAAYFDSFSRSLFIVDKSHECNEVLASTYNAGSE